MARALEQLAEQVNAQQEPETKTDTDSNDV